MFGTGDFCCLSFNSETGICADLILSASGIPAKRSDVTYIGDSKTCSILFDYDMVF